MKKDRFSLRTFNKVLLAAFFLICQVVANPAGAAGIEMKIGLPAINDPMHSWTQKYKTELEKRTGGQIDVRIFPASQLGSMPAQLENVQLGTQEALFAPTAFLIALNKAMQVPDAPGLFAGRDQAQAAVTHPSFREKFLRIPESRGVVGAAIWNYGPSALASVKPIPRLSDFKGLKVRILPTDTERARVEALGMSGIAMPFNETLPAIQQGSIDGAISNLVVMGSTKFYNRTKHVVVMEDTMIFCGLWVSKAWLDKLPAQLRKSVFDVGRELESWGNENAANYENRMTSAWVENGAKIHTLSAEDKRTLMDKVAPIGDRLLRSDPLTAEMWGLLKAARK